MPVEETELWTGDGGHARKHSRRPPVPGHKCGGCVRCRPHLPRRADPGANPPPRCPGRHEAVRTRPRPGLMLSYETLDRNLAQHRKATASSPAREERPC